jgi:hypothetical protein
VILASLLVAYPASVWAAPSDAELATARQLFNEGVALEDAKDWAAALDRFRRVAAVKATPQVRYNVGFCLAKTGQLVEAVNALSPLAELSGDRDTLALAALARRQLAEIRPRVPHLLVNGPRGLDATVTLDGHPVSPALLGTSMLVDPGPHTLIAARASGSGRTEQRVVVAEGGAVPVVVNLELPPELASTAPPNEPSRRRSIPISAYVAGGLTVAVLSTAVIMAIERGSAISELNSKCGAGGQFCPDDLHGLVNQAQAYTIAADTLTVLGVLGAATTGTLIVLAPKIVPSSQGSIFGASVVGRF